VAGSVQLGLPRRIRLPINYYSQLPRIPDTAQQRESENYLQLKGTFEQLSRSTEKTVPLLPKLFHSGAEDFLHCQVPVA
jgi:hypothetical protein